MKVSSAANSPKQRPLIGRYLAIGSGEPSVSRACAKRAVGQRLHLNDSDCYLAAKTRQSTFGPEAVRRQRAPMSAIQYFIPSTRNQPFAAHRAKVMTGREAVIRLRHENDRLPPEAIIPTLMLPP